MYPGYVYLILYIFLLLRSLLHPIWGDAFIIGRKFLKLGIIKDLATPNTLVQLDLTLAE